MNKYQVVNEVPLGRGGEGMVLEVTKKGQKDEKDNKKDKEVFVMKQRVCFNLEDANNGLSEALSLARFQHENIVHFEDIFIHVPSPTTSISTSSSITSSSEDHHHQYYYVCIVMELCTGGNLFEYLRHHHDSGPGGSTRSSTSMSPSIPPSLSHRSSTSISSSSPSVTSPPLTTTTPSSTPSSSSTPLFSPSRSSTNISSSPFSSPATISSTDILSSPVKSPSTSSLLGVDVTIVEKEFLPRHFLIEWMLQLCHGVQAIHSAKLVHRDLKSENIFISNNNVLKIGDFGLATLHNNEKVKGAVGTYYYSSPELLKDKVYDRSGDIFSLGCIFYEMATLNLLACTRTCFGEQMLNNTFDATKFLADFPEDCKDIGALVLKMLNVEPSLRPHVDAILKDNILIASSDENPNVSIEKYFAKYLVEGSVIRQLLLTDGTAFATVMARAYAKDPLFEYVVHNKEANREEILKAIFKQAFKIFQTRRFSVWGYFDRTKRLVAASVWVPPDHKDRRPSLSSILHIVFSTGVVMSIGLSAIRRYKKSVERIQQVAKDKDCWHLMYIGVDPEHQNKHIGTALARPITHWADQQAMPITACTYYERECEE